MTYTPEELHVIQMVWAPEYADLTLAEICALAASPAPTKPAECLDPQVCRYPADRCVEPSRCKLPLADRAAVSVPAATFRVVSETDTRTATDESYKAWCALQRFIHHRDGCPCATQAHTPSDCTCGMYAAVDRVRVELVKRPAPSELDTLREALRESQRVLRHAERARDEAIEQYALYSDLSHDEAKQNVAILASYITPEGRARAAAEGEVLRAASPDEGAS